MNLLPSIHWLLSLTLLACWPACVCADPLEADNWPSLPNAVDSFGAAEHDEYVYIYGGHQGPQQQQTGSNLSRSFARQRLSDHAAWEQLPTVKPIQNLALVSCGDYLYQIGGTGLLDEANPSGSIRSTSAVNRYDPRTNTWTVMPPLPAPRSAHDAIAFEDKIYVVGGWDHTDDHANDWHDSALMLDTADGVDATWKSLPIPSFRRRGLAVAAWQNHIWAIGGKDDDGVIHRTVYYYDPQRGYWSEGPELPARADGLQGYGVAAWGLDSGLYVSGADGVLYRLNSLYGAWEKVAELRVQRFCHRLVPDGKTALLALAGYSVSYGQTSSVERIKVYTP
jgi:N-acetylneuraminic acid mutarotase